MVAATGLGLTSRCIARMCHETNRAYCELLGDTSQKKWEEAPEWQQASAILGVDAVLANPNISSSETHESWLKAKRAEGWKYGLIKDAERKEHPCFVSYNDLPPQQRRKDALFRHVVLAFLEKV